MDTPPVDPTPRTESNTTVFSLDPRSERHPGIHMPPPPLVDTPQRHSGTLEQRTDNVELMFPQHLEVPVEIGREDNDDAGSRLSNTWCRYVHQTARRLGENDCYLCSRLMAVIAGGSGREWGGTMGHVTWTSG